MTFLKNNWRKLASAAVLILVATILVLNNERTKSSDSTIADKKEYVVLSVSGEVAVPGSYKIRAGTSVMDNLHLFGGFTMYADTSKGDLYKPLTEDTSITVKIRSASDNRNYDSLYSIPD